VPNTTTVIVGAGHCGLAMSRCLAARSIDHVVLERGEVANSWRTQRWDSLRLLTPNWMTRLPGYAYRGADPDGYLSARQVRESSWSACQGFRRATASCSPGSTNGWNHWRNADEHHHDHPCHAAGRCGAPRAKPGPLSR
jgi:glycine/D-amino acid oxidase-like deaminating enzyme